MRIVQLDENKKEGDEDTPSCSEVVNGILRKKNTVKYLNFIFFSLDILKARFLHLSLKN